MNPKKNSMVSPKIRTGITGFDNITNGGLPRHRTTLIEGGPGSGKTIMALQTLVNGARHDKENGIFVAFEESVERISANAAQFGWDLAELQKEKLFFLDAQPSLDNVQSGSFDLGGLLAILEAKAAELKPAWLVLDAVDVVLSMMNDPAAEKREAYRLHEWLLARKFTAIITSKVGYYRDIGLIESHLAFMQYMVDCTVTLNHEVVQGISQRNLRVIKYRGSSFSENAAPFLIGENGLEVAGSRGFDRSSAPVSSKRVSSGVARLDDMLGGGYYQGAGVLITGFPGTAKSTLAGAFAEAACARGEKTLFLSFDSDANEVVRNLASVNIRLDRFIKKGMLRLVSARAITGSAEIHLMQIKNMAMEQGSRCLVVDPVSALSKAGNREAAYSVAERLIDWIKAMGITLVCTSLLDHADARMEGTPIQISTIADTWIHLSYLMQAGERNRGLSIVKSRGTSHSNQVRELILSKKGVTLADAYMAGGEVLMGTLRWEKEVALRNARSENLLQTKLKQSALENEEALLEGKLKALQVELDIKRKQKQALVGASSSLSAAQASDLSHLRERRWA
jgi:circadian clock protein KaiC